MDLESIAKSEMNSFSQIRQSLSKRASGGNIDIVYASLHLSPNMNTAYLVGNVNYFFKTTGAVNEIDFDLRKELTVDSVVFRGQKVTFVHTHSTEMLKVIFGMTIPTGALDSLNIFYRGTPDQSNRAYARNVTASGPIIATLSEPYGAHYWWPCRENLSDKIDSLDMRVTVDTQYKVASNGMLKSVTMVNDTMHTYHWQHRYPLATYLVAFSASRYATYSDYALLKNGQQLEILNYVFPHHESDARLKTKATIPVMQLFDSLFGTYPFHKERYGHAQFTVSGGMEHQTMSFMGNFGYDLIAHELAHQWFGDKITCGTWHDLWLNESFATYCNLLCYDFLKPESEWLTQLRNFKKDVMSQEDGSVYAKDTANVGALFNYRTTYQKGAMVLHQLRWVVGDKAFFDGIRNFLQSTKLAYGFAFEDDLQSHLEATSGMDLEYYFNSWIKGEGYPTYTINWQLGQNKEVSIDIIQTQSHSSVLLYSVPLPVLLKGDGVDSLIVIPVKKGVENFKITLPFNVKELVFDPDEWILGKNKVQFISKPSEDMFTIYPNPSKGEFNIIMHHGDMVGWNVFDFTGKEVLTKTYNEKILNGYTETLDLNTLASGIYTIYIRTPYNIFPQLIVIQ